MINFYELLGVDRKVTSQQIRTAIDTHRDLLNATPETSEEDRSIIVSRLADISLAERVLLEDPKLGELGPKRYEYNGALDLVVDLSNDSSINTAELLRRAKSEVIGKHVDNSEAASAVVFSEHATELEPENSEAWQVLGHAYYRWGDSGRALNAISRALRLNPLNGQAHGVQAKLFDDKNRDAEAVRAFERCFEIDRELMQEYALSYWACLCATGEFEKAIRFLEEQISTESSGSPRRDGLGQALVSTYCSLVPTKWTRVGEEFLGGIFKGERHVTSRAQLEESLTLLEKVRDIKVTSDSVKSEIHPLTEAILNSAERRWHGSAIGGVLGMIIWSFFYGLGFILAPAYFFVSRPPGYLISRAWLEREVTADQEASTQTGVDKLGAYAVNGAALPVMVVKGYLKNYTGEQKNLDSLIVRARALKQAFA